MTGKISYLINGWVSHFKSAFPKNKPYDIKTGYQEYRGNAHKHGNNNKCGNVCRCKNDLHKFVFRPLDAKSLQNICASHRIIEQSKRIYLCRTLLHNSYEIMYSFRIVQPKYLYTGLKTLQYYQIALCICVNKRFWFHKLSILCQ